MQTNKTKHFLQVIELDSTFQLFTKTANFTLHFWELFILGLPMETVCGVRWFYDKHAVGMCMRAGHGTFLLLELRFPKLDPASFEGYSKKTTLQ